MSSEKQGQKTATEITLREVGWKQYDRLVKDGASEPELAEARLYIQRKTLSVYLNQQFS